MSLFNVSLPTKEQWINVAKAAAFSFVSTFLAAFTAAGGIQSDWAATFVLASAAVVSAVNSTLYLLYVTLFQQPKE